MTVINIYTDADLEALFEEYCCSSLDLLAECLAPLNKVLVDRRPSAELSQCEAQNSPEFADEAISESEFDELQNLRAIYRYEP